MDWRTAKLVAGVVAAIGLGGVQLAQEPKGQEPKPPAVLPGKTAQQWIGELGSDSYRERLEAEKALRAMGKEALPDLRKAAEDASDSEAQWRARRLVRQIERGTSGGLQQRERAAPGDPGRDTDTEPAPRQGQPFWRGPSRLPEGMRQQFDQLFEQFERDFGLDVPRARFFQDDFFRDLQEQMKDLQGRSQGLSMQIGPDGAVRVEVQQKNEKGEVEKKVYEAPDLETFHKQYPGVLEQNGLGSPFRLWIDGMPGQDPRRRVWSVDPQAPRLLPFRALQPVPEADRVVPVPAPGVGDVPPPDGKRLGVFVKPEIPAELREHLELAEGVGLMVESVQKGSLAEALGLARGDIVVSVAGREIGSTDDVQEALGAIAAGAAVEVRFLRKGVEKTATAKKPAAAEAGEGGDGRLERRAPKAAGETIR